MVGFSLLCLFLLSISCLLSSFLHLLPTLRTCCLGKGWAFSDDSHLLSSLCPPFLPVAWGKGGRCLAFPTFRTSFSYPSYPLPGQRVGGAWLFPSFEHPFPTPHTCCLGKGWALPGFSHLSDTLFPSFIPLACEKGGHCLAFPIFLPHFSHSFPTLHTSCLGEESQVHILV